MGKIIAIVLPKGGVGKTTTAINLAYALAQNKKRTLLIDVDPSGQCATALGFTDDKIKGDILDVFSFSKSFKNVIHKTDDPNLDFVPIRRLSYNNEKRLANLASRELILKDVLDSEVYSYNYILIDCPPSLIGTTTNVLIAADSVLIPIKAAKFSLNEVDRIMEHINYIKDHRNANLRIEGILLTMHERNTKVAFKVKKELLLKYPNLMMKISIPKNIEVAESTFLSKPIILTNPDAKSSKAYIKLADELLANNSFNGVKVV
ncbi:sporulation initiation inhibitor protein Soj [bacterium BMS3Abin04]|nr:sporulation initiation inhibitor protein Soj [bacterium BMS3Abin04]